jgi:hypothetical protein
MNTTQQTPAFALITMPLPGPDRKRTPSYYHYRTTFRNHHSDEAGCVMTWEVLGGREPYQIALERTAQGQYRWHCTCADAVYRGEVNPQHVCKHVQGLTALLPPAGAVPPGSVEPAHLPAAA